MPPIVAFVAGFFTCVALILFAHGCFIAGKKQQKEDSERNKCQ
jgi:hypothetical protein